MPGIRLILLAFALADAPPAQAPALPERPPDELLELLQNVDLLEGYGDLLELEASSEPAPRAPATGPVEPGAAPGVRKGDDGTP
jgi:hypothetical protein